jgi:hypothetical protein
MVFEHLLALALPLGAFLLVVVVSQRAGRVWPSVPLVGAVAVGVTYVVATYEGEDRLLVGASSAVIVLGNAITLELFLLAGRVLKRLIRQG